MNNNNNTDNQPHWMMTAVIFMTCVVAAYSAQKGISTSTGDIKLSVGAAVACGFAVFVFCEWLMRNLPAMNTKSRYLSAGLAGVIMIMMFFFSTQWTVVAIGGRTAMNAHLNKMTAEADEAALRIYRQLTIEKNMEPQLRALATQFESLATREASNEFSGMKGKGDVYSSLMSTSQVFNNAAETIKGVATEGDELYAQYQALSDKGRKIMEEIQGTEVTDSKKVRALNTAFGNNLSQINRVLIRMRGTSAREFVKTMNSSLAQLAMVPQESSTPEQKAAIARLAPQVQAAQKIVNQITSGDALVEDANQNFAMMEPADAIWVYKGNIGGAWGAAVALDLIPFILGLCSILTPKRRDENEETSQQSTPRPRRVSTGD